ncbi:polysaccharide biosynthesis/export family protein [Novosphingobium resinovorum]|uniref:polysaccharide biosynthesis/export family protein n=1 Tax=Novosphingobium resinovorum TaxID=158500 RepID=UPI002ED48D9C|nr:polysaccharide biosynthesis/export family protein [Novosphingobium resinovorum]
MFHSNEADRPRPARRKRRVAFAAGMIAAAALFAQDAAAQAKPGAGVAAVTGAQSTAAMPDRPAMPRYVVKAGDQLDVFVWGEERMQRQVLVQPDGTFAFPLAGTIRADGRNVSDIADDIRGRIALNYTSAPPDVTVTVRETDGTRFYVLGKVRTPGSFTSGSAPNILQALSMAGGTAEFADTGGAVILRQTPAGQVVERIRLGSLLKGARSLKAGALSTPLPTLSSGDVLLIP